MPEILEETLFNKDYIFEVRCNNCGSLIEYELNELEYLPFLSKNINDLYYMNNDERNLVVAKCPVLFCNNYININIQDYERYVASLVYNYNNYSQFIGRKINKDEWTNCLLYDHCKLSYKIDDIKIHNCHYTVRINDKIFIITNFLSKEDKDIINKKHKELI